MPALRAVCLFSGVGGLDAALERHGIHIVAQVENDPYCNAVLALRWPDVPRYGDIKEIDWDEFTRRHGPIDLVAGGFPCQPVSQAGRRKAQADPRWLWPEVARCVRHLRPGYVFLENTLGLLSRGLDSVLGDLAALFYDAVGDCFQAADVGAPHERDRVFIMAYANGVRESQPAWWDAQGGGRPEHGSQEVANAGQRRRNGREAGAGGGGDAAVGDQAGVGSAVGLALLADAELRGRDGLHERQQPRHLAPDAGDRGQAGGGGSADELDGRGVAVGGVMADAERGELQRRPDPRSLADPQGAGAGQGLQREWWGDAAGDGGPAGRPRPGVVDTAGPGRRPAGSPAEPDGAAGSARQLQPQGRGRGAWTGEGSAESGVGRGADGPAGWLDGHRWPAPPGPDQYSWEPPRTIGRGLPNRAARVKALGNAVVPQQGALAFAVLWQRMLQELEAKD